MRARPRFKTGFAAGATIYHKEGGSIGSSRETSNRSAMSEYYLARSKILFGRKHSDAKLPVLMGPNILLQVTRATHGHLDQIGSALCREGVCLYGEVSVGAGVLIKKKNIK